MEKIYENWHWSILSALSYIQCINNLHNYMNIVIQDAYRLWMVFCDVCQQTMRIDAMNSVPNVGNLRKDLIAAEN